MADLKKKLEDARGWLLAAVPASSGRADRHPLYVILRELINELDKLRDEFTKHQLTEFNRISISGSNTESAEVSKNVTYVMSLDANYQDLQERIDELYRRVETLQLELEDKMRTGIIEKLEAMYKKIAEDRESLEKKFKNLEQDTKTAFAELVKMIAEE